MLRIKRVRFCFYIQVTTDSLGHGLIQIQGYNAENMVGFVSRGRLARHLFENYTQEGYEKSGHLHQLSSNQTVAFSSICESELKSKLGGCQVNTFHAH